MSDIYDKDIGTGCILFLIWVDLNMNIKFEKVGEGWKADLLDLPGTPPCGEGFTKEMAVACLFYRIIAVSRINNSSNWIDYVNVNEKLLVDGIMYSDPSWKK